MQQDIFNIVVDLLPYIVFGGAALFTLILLMMDWIIEKNSK